jgi:hypothetical protein
MFRSTKHKIKAAPQHALRECARGTVHVQPQAHGVVCGRCGTATDLDGVFLAGSLHVGVEFLKVSLDTAAVKLHGVETKVVEGLDVAGVELGVGGVVLGAAAIVACRMMQKRNPVTTRFWGLCFDALLTIPAGSKLEAVGMVGHALHVGEKVGVDNGVTSGVVEVGTGGLGSSSATLLPVVVEALRIKDADEEKMAGRKGKQGTYDVIVAKVKEGGGDGTLAILEINHAVLLDHAIHDTLHERLVDIVTVKVPRTPALSHNMPLIVQSERNALWTYHGRRASEAIFGALGDREDKSDTDELEHAVGEKTRRQHRAGYSAGYSLL